MKKRVFRNFYQEKATFETSLVVQWLRLHSSTTGDTGSIPGQETKISHAMWHGQKKKKRKKEKATF